MRESQLCGVVSSAIYFTCPFSSLTIATHATTEIPLISLYASISLARMASSVLKARSLFSIAVMTPETCFRSFRWPVGDGLAGILLQLGDFIDAFLQRVGKARPAGSSSAGRVCRRNSAARSFADGQIISNSIDHFLI